LGAAAHHYIAFVSKDTSLYGLIGFRRWWSDEELLLEGFDSCIINITGQDVLNPHGFCHKYREKLVVFPRKGIGYQVFFSFLIFNVAVKFEQFEHQLVLDTFSHAWFSDVLEALLICF
jgi:hypothetical protein